MRTTRVIFALALLGCVACPGDPPVRAPFNLTIETKDDFDRVQMVWGRFDTNCDEYQLEFSIDGGQWRNLSTEKLDCQVIGVKLNFNTNSELITIDFRLRAVQGGRFSDWVSARLVRGIRPPTMTGAHDPARESNDLAWVNRSTATTTPFLERAPLLDGFRLGPWTALPTSPNATSYSDQVLEEAVSYRYRVRYVSGNVFSDSSEWVSPPIPLLPPRDFRATVTAEGTRFSWTNRSTHAAFLELDSTRLEPSATTLLLPTFPWPGTTYELALVSGGALAFSNAITLESFRIPAMVATLDAGGLRPSQSGHVNTIARSGVGAWEMVAGFSCEESRPPSGAVLDASVHCLDPTGGLISPGLRLDDAGNPHLLVSTFDTALQRRTHHQWRDRDGWHSEILPLDVGSVRTFDVDAAGGLRLLASRASPGATEYGELVDGIWKWTVVPGSDAMSEFSFRMVSRASDGTPQILMQDSVGLVAVALRQPDGSFVSESIGSTAAAALVTGAGGKPGVAFVRDGKAFFVQREQGSWLAPEEIAEVKFGTRIWAASTPDGTRVDAVFVQPSDLASRSRLDLWRRGGAGWRGMTLASGDVLEVTGGHLSEGKLWIVALAGLRQAPTPFEWATWQEP